MQHRILIAAVAENFVIGRHNTLPWHLPDDWARFRARTAGQPFVMGRLSFESPDALLSDYRNVILSNRTDLQLPPRCELAHNWQQVWQLLENEPDVFILGGAKVFAEALPQANRLYLTEVHAQVDGDAFFPHFDRKEWLNVRREYHPADAEHAYAFTFADYERV